MFNPFKPNGISQHYQLEQCISVVRDVGWYLSFLFPNFDRPFQKQTVETLNRCCRMLHRVLLRTRWLCPTKRTLGLYGIMGDSTKRVFLSTVEKNSKLLQFSINPYFRHLFMTPIIASLQRYCVGKVPMAKLLRHYKNLIARNWPRNTNALIDGNPVSYFNSSCRFNHLTSLLVHICSYVMTSLQE